MFFDIYNKNSNEISLECVDVSIDTSMMDDMTQEVMEAFGDFEKAAALIESVSLEAEEAKKYKNDNVKSIISKIKEFFMKLIQNCKAFFESLRSKFVGTIDGMIKYVDEHFDEIEKSASGPDVTVEMQLYNIDKIKQMWEDITNNAILEAFKKVRVNDYISTDPFGNKKSTNQIELRIIGSSFAKYFNVKSDVGINGIIKPSQVSEGVNEFIKKNVITEKVLVNKKYREIIQSIKDMKNLISETDKLSKTITKSLKNIMDELIKACEKIDQSQRRIEQQKQLIPVLCQHCISYVQCLSSALIKCAQVNAKTGYMAVMAMTNKNRTKSGNLI